MLRAPPLLITLLELFLVACENKVDIAFLIDSSGSIGISNWRTLREFIISVIRDFTVSSDGNHAAAIVYSSNAEVAFDFNTLQGSSVTAAEYGKLVNELELQRGLNFIDKALLLANSRIFTRAGGMRKDASKVKKNMKYCS